MASIERRFALHVPSSTENLALIREFISGVGGRSGLPADELGKLELAVDEACTNVIEHAYGHDTTKEVIVRATFDEEQIQIEVIDTGRGFEPEDVKQEEVLRLIEQRARGGLGMRLMKALMDEVHYELEPGKMNELRMVKKIRRPDG